MNTPSYKKRRNVLIISFSPDLNEAVQKVRLDLGIPGEGLDYFQDRGKWYKQHYAQNSQEPFKALPDYYWHFPREFVELLESFSYSNEPSRVNYYPSVPLDRCAMDLIKKFDLPGHLVGQLKSYILYTKRTLGLGPALQLILVPINEGDEGTKYVALIAGIDEATTEKDWLRLWEDITRLLRFSGKNGLPSKRPMDPLLMRDLSFWTQQKAGKKAKEIIEMWINKHKEDENLGEDTVRKAVERIDRIMKGHS